MLPIRKWRRGVYLVFILTLLSAIGPPVVSAEEDLPAGFKADRYQKIWERNPFTLVTPAALQVRPSPFDKLILVSWLNDGGKDVVFIENTETSEVQKVTDDPNPNKLRLVEVHKNADPKKADVVLSNGAEKGSVRFRLDMPAVSQQASGGQQPPGTPNGAQGRVPGTPQGAPIQPGAAMPRQQNGQQGLPQPARVGAAQMQPGAVPAQPDNGMTAPRASEVRRKRITPPPQNEQPVGVQTPYQNPSNQAPPQ